MGLDKYDFAWAIIILLVLIVVILKEIAIGRMM